MLKITQSLLSSWLYFINADDEYSETAYEGFLKSLNKQSKERTEAMQKGIDFENEINRIVKGGDFNKDRTDLNCIVEIALIVQGGISQCYAEKTLKIKDYDVKLYGYLDYLKAGTIYDIKRISSSYNYGKYFSSPQHSCYFEIIEGATKFEYLICDGKNVYKEVYFRDNGYEPADSLILRFFNWLDENGLFEIYKSKWTVKEDANS